MITAEQKTIIQNSIRKFSPTSIGVFGSYARGEQTSNSDLDLLVDFENTINLLDLIGLEQELSDLLEIKVDLVTLKSINKDLKLYIEQDLISLL